MEQKGSPLTPTQESLLAEIAQTIGYKPTELNGQVAELMRSVVTDEQLNDILGRMNISAFGVAQDNWAGLVAENPTLEIAASELYDKLTTDTERFRPNPVRQRLGMLGYN